MDVFNRKGKTNGFLIVFIDLSCSTFKDEDVKEQNYDTDFQSEGKNQRFFNGFVMTVSWMTSLQNSHVQSEGKNQWFFNGVVMTLNLDDFNTKWSFSIRSEIPMVFL